MSALWSSVLAPEPLNRFSEIDWQLITSVTCKHLILVSQYTSYC